jgi:transposase
VNELLEEKKFDEFADADNIGRPSLAPGIYFRLLLVGYFEGIDSGEESLGGRRIR